MTLPEALKSIPYGQANFHCIRSEHYGYADKTRFIHRIEQTGQRAVRIVRPRRFGKTLFALTLRSFYDRALADAFAHDFSGTDIAKFSPSSAGSFVVMNLDFSGISLDSFATGFMNKVKDGLSSLCRRYAFKEGWALLKADYASAEELLDVFLTALQEKFRDKIYLVIDEYDQAVNVLFVGDTDFSLRKRVSVILRNFYAWLDTELTSGHCIAQAFITGVTRMKEAEIASVTDLTEDADFADMYGLTEKELRIFIPQVMDPSTAGTTTDALVEHIMTLYGGWRFTAGMQIPVCNPSMCLFYLDALKRRGREPESLQDPAFAADLSKIETLLSLTDAEFADAVLGEVLCSRNPGIGFAGLKFLEIGGSGALSLEEVLSLLVYFGLLTRSGLNAAMLMAPNPVGRLQFFEHYLRNVLHADNPYWNSRAYGPATLAYVAGESTPLKYLSDCLFWVSEGGKHRRLSERELEWFIQGAASLAPLIQA